MCKSYPDGIRRLDSVGRGNMHMQRPCGLMGAHVVSSGDLEYPEFGMKSAFRLLTQEVGKPWSCCVFLCPARVGPGWPITRD